MLLFQVINVLLNVFRTIPTAATAVTGMAAGATIIIDRPPTSTLDWVVIVAGGVGMLANVIHANLVALQNG